MAEALQSALKALADDRWSEEETTAERRIREEERAVREQEGITERIWLQEERDARVEEVQRRMEILVRLVERPRRGKNQVPKTRAEY